MSKEDQSKSFESKLKVLRSDNGGEYLSNEFKAYLAQHGIKHELTVAYTPQQNGVAERMNRTLLDLTRAMLHHKKIDKIFWAEALTTAVYIRNRVTSRALSPNLTPHHLWHGEAPVLSNLRVFGSRCWYTIPRKKVKKLDHRATEKKKKFVISRDVKFDESDEDLVSDPEPNDTAFYDTEDDAAETEEESARSSNDSSRGSDDESESSDTPKQVGDSSEPARTEEVRAAPQVTRSGRQSKPTSDWWVAPPHSLPTSEAATIAQEEVALLTSGIYDDVPVSYRQATSSKNIDFWMPGIKKEQDALMENKTFELVSRTPSMHVLPCRYVFRVKQNAPKVRIVAKGFRQIQGVDYNETFAPVVMEVPAGFKDPKRPNLVCKLLKALYGLKQAPRMWNAKIHSFLVDNLGFFSSPHEPCVYIKRQHGIVVMIILLYVDDILIAGMSRINMDKVKAEFKARFKMKDLGPASEFLGIEIIRDRNLGQIIMKQSAYANKILERFSMSNCKPTTTPMVTDASKILDSVSNPLPASTPYRSAIGSLMYLMICTRPDIAYAVGKLSRYCENPTQAHWSAVKRIFRYIKGTQNSGLTLRLSGMFDLVGYCDADWGGCLRTRKSTDGVLFVLAGTAISWKSKRQSIVALSTCEAEYIVTCSGAKEASYLARLLCDMLGTDAVPTIPVYVDNDGAIDLASKEAVSQRTKHIDIRYHYIREALSNKRISLHHIDTKKQLADPLTKPLGPILHRTLCTQMGVSNLIS